MTEIETNWEYEPQFNHIKKFTDARKNATKYQFEFSGWKDGYNGNPTTAEHPKIVSFNAPRVSGAAAGKPFAPALAIDKFEYEPRGLKEFETDPAGHRTHYKYDAIGYLQEHIRDEGGQAIKVVTKRDLRGFVIELVDEENNSTTFKRNLAGLSVLTTDPLAHKFEFEYDTENHLTDEYAPWQDDFTEDGVGGHMGPTKVWTRYEYDPLGNLTAKSDDEYVLRLTTRYVYDEADRVIEVRTPLAGDPAAPGAEPRNTTSYVYNELGLISRITRAKGSGDDGAEERFFYDGAGNQTAHRDGAGYITTAVFDGFGRQKELHLPNGSIITYTYDATHNLTAEEMKGDPGIHFPKLGATSLQRRKVYVDEWNRPYQERAEVFDIGSSTWDKMRDVLYVYDDDNCVQQLIRPREGSRPADIVTLHHDSLHRLESEEDSLGNRTDYKYWPRGMQRSKTETDVSTRDGSKEVLVTEYDFDKLKRLTEMRVGPAQVYKKRYDSLGHVRLTAEPVNRKAGFIYDGAGRLLQSGEFYETRDIGTNNPPFGTQVTLQSTDAVWTFRDYDNNSRLTAVRAPASRTRYEYDAQNRLRKVFEPARSGSGETQMMEVVFDGANRLRRYSDASGTKVVVTHDSMGNVTVKQVTFGKGIEGTRREQHKYDGAGRLVASLDLDNLSYLAYTYNSAGDYRQEIQAVPAVTKHYPNGSFKVGLTHQVSFSAQHDAQGFRNQMQMRYTGAGAVTPKGFSAGRSFDYGRDALGRVSQLSVTANGACYLTAQHRYLGRDSRLHSREYPGKDHILTLYRYDSQRRLRSVQHSNPSKQHGYGYSVTLEVSAAGHLDSRTIIDRRLLGDLSVPDPIRADTFAYDNRGQLLSETQGDDVTPAPRGVSATVYDICGTPLQTVRANRDAMLTIGEYALRWWYGDARPDTGRYYRTVESSQDLFEGVPQSKDIQRFKVDVDPNWLARLRSQDWVVLPGDQAQFKFDERGSLKEIWGMVPSRMHPEDPAQRTLQKIKEISYDYKGRPVKFFDWVRRDFVSTGDEWWVHCRYDPLNRLVQLSVNSSDATPPPPPANAEEFSRRFIWDREHMLEELQWVGTPAALRPTRRYSRSPSDGHLLAYEFRSRADAASDSSFDTWYVCTDATGAPLYLADSSGETIEAYDASVRGDERIVSRAQIINGSVQIAPKFILETDKYPSQDQLFSESPLGFPFSMGGHLFEPISGFLYMRNRWYSPQLGQFISRDPMELSGNRYSYAGNNPSSGADPTGAFVIFALLAVQQALSIVDFLNTPVGNLSWGQIALKVGKLAAATVANKVPGLSNALGLAAEGIAGAIAVDAVDMIGNIALDALESTAFDGLSTLLHLQKEEIGAAEWMGSGARVSQAFWKILPKQMRFLSPLYYGARTAFDRIFLSSWDPIRRIALGGGVCFANLTAAERTAFCSAQIRVFEEPISARAWLRIQAIYRVNPQRAGHVYSRFVSYTMLKTVRRSPGDIKEYYGLLKGRRHDLGNAHEHALYGLRGGGLGDHKHAQVWWDLFHNNGTAFLTVPVMNRTMHHELGAIAAYYETTFQRKALIIVRKTTPF